MSRRPPNPITWPALVIHIISLIAFIATLAAIPAVMTIRWWFPYLLLAMLVSTVGFAVILLAHRRTLVGRIVTAMSCHAIVLIAFFSLAYCDVGRKMAERDTPSTFTDAVYFSIVTWTTLGYGDLHPPSSLKMMAALEAIIGYIYLGLIVGLAANLFRPPEQCEQR